MLIIIRLLQTTFLIILFSCTNDTKSNFDNQGFVKYKNQESFDQFVKKIRLQYQLPGLAVAHIVGDSIYNISVQGYNKAINGTKLDYTSRFQIASCTKSFTALLTSTFVNEGLLGWNSTLEDIYPDFELQDAYKNVSIKQLLSHTSGLRNFTNDQEVFSVRFKVPNLKGSTSDNRKTFSLWNLSQPPQYTIGEHHYSNAGYVIIGSILERISGKSYERLINERIFEPLGLYSPVFGYPFLNNNKEPHRHMERRYDGTGIPFSRFKRIPDSLFNPAGFISLTISDFAMFVIENKKILKRKQSILSNKAAMELFKPQIELSNGYQISLGWQIIPVNGIQTYGHTGGDQTIRAAMAINPSNDTAVVFATNIGDDISELALVNTIVELINLKH